MAKLEAFGSILSSVTTFLGLLFAVVIAPNGFREWKAQKRREQKAEVAARCLVAMSELKDHVQEKFFPLTLGDPSILLKFEESKGRQHGLNRSTLARFRKVEIDAEVHLGRDTAFALRETKAFCRNIFLGILGYKSYYTLGKDPIIWAFNLDRLSEIDNRIARLRDSLESVIQFEEAKLLNWQIASFEVKSECDSESTP